jgi:hypothetical protein
MQSRRDGGHVLTARIPGKKSLPVHKTRFLRCEIGMAEAGKAQVLGLEELETPGNPGYFSGALPSQLLKRLLSHPGPFWKY